MRDGNLACNETNGAASIDAAIAAKLCCSAELELSTCRPQGRLYIMNAAADRRSKIPAILLAHSGGRSSNWRCSTRIPLHHCADY